MRENFEIFCINQEFLQHFSLHLFFTETFLCKSTNYLWDNLLLLGILKLIRPVL